jgi:hypothetical protein
MKKITTLLILTITIACAEEYQIKDISIVKEVSTSYSFQEIKDSSKAKFEPYQPDSLQHKTVSYWLRFKFFKGDIQKSFYFIYPYLIFKNMELYYYDKDSLYTQKSGSDYTLKERSRYTHYLTLLLPTASDTVVCYLHLTHFYGYSFYPVIAPDTELLKTNISTSNTEFFFFGITALSIVFSLLLYLYLRERLYVYYLLFASMLLLSRAVHNGYLVDYLPFNIKIDNVFTIFHIYALANAGITISLLLYFSSFLSIGISKPLFRRGLILLIGVRLILLFIYFSISDFETANLFNHKYIDLFMQASIILLPLDTFNKSQVLSIVSLGSILVILTGNIIHNFNITFLNMDSYQLYMTFSNAEVVFFLIALGHRHYFLRKEKENALHLVIEKMKETELLKDAVNRELEQKVAERTEEIRKMNEILKSHNIELSHEVEDITKARIFQKNMSFKEFSKMFPSDESCYKYIADVKWSGTRKYKCQKCGCETSKGLDNFYKRCTRCSFVESPSSGTLFHNLKFSIQKAFYITYFASTGSKEKTIEEGAKELELRMATYFKFRTKVLELIEKTKTKKKHKDGWTQLIEYSIDSK